MKNEMYHKHAKLYAQKIESNIYNAMYERPSLLKMLPDVDGRSVLDMGCGPGIYSRYLMDQGAKVKAIDESGEMVRLVQENLGDVVDCQQLDLTAGLPIFSDAEFDLVISPLVVHYIVDWASLFKEVARVLRPGGIFLFSTHHPFCDIELSPSGNYFATEKIVEEWNTIDQPVEVSFYRRPLVDIITPIAQAGMLIMALSEGQCGDDIKAASASDYLRLSTRPNFLFLKCLKPKSG